MYKCYGSHLRVKMFLKCRALTCSDHSFTYMHCMYLKTVLMLLKFALKIHLDLVDRGGSDLKANTDSARRDICS